MLEKKPKTYSLSKQKSETNSVILFKSSDEYLAKNTLKK